MFGNLWNSLLGRATSSESDVEAEVGVSGRENYLLESERPGLSRRLSELGSKTFHFEEDVQFDDIDRHNGFHLFDHYTLKASLERKKGLVLLNEGQNQFIFEPRRRYPFFNDDEHGFYALLPENGKKSNPFDQPSELRQNLKGQNDGTFYGDQIATISIKKAKRYGIGLILLKCLYSYVAVVLGSYFVAFSIILLLQFTLGVFLAGITSKNYFEAEASALSLFSLPLLLQALSIVLNLFFGFVRDGWDDFSFLHTMSFLPRFIRDWISILVGLVIPLTVCVVSFLIRSETPWQNTLLACFWCTLAFYVLYTILVMILQISACISLTKYKRKVSLLWVQLELVYLRMVTGFAFTQTLADEEGTNHRRQLPDLNPFANFFYKRVLKRIYEFDRYGEVAPYVTEDIPSVLLFCCLLSSRLRGGIKFTHLLNSGICVIITVVLIWLLFVGYLVYNAGFILLATALCAVSTALFIFIVLALNTRSIREAYRNARNSYNEKQEKNKLNRITRAHQAEVLGVYAKNPYEFDDGRSTGSATSEFLIDLEQELHRGETYITAEPRLFTAAIFSLLVLYFFIILPLRSFYFLGVPGYFGLFMSFSVLVLLQAVFNVRTLVEILGPKAQQRLEKMYRKNKVKSERARCVYLLVTRLLQPQRGIFFLVVLTIAIIFALSLAAASLNDTVLMSDDDGWSLIGSLENRTHFVPRRTRNEIGFQYPGCELGFTQLKLLDFAFLAEVAYVRRESTQEYLNKWFGKDVMRILNESAYPKDIPPRHSKTVFKALETNVEKDGKAAKMFIITVRGTTSALDLLSDAQSWLPVLMVQTIRSMIPFGYVWNSLLPNLIYYMNTLETSPASRSVYYVDVINAVRSFKKHHPEALIAVTGHSLGGGVAIITGAKLKVPAIAFSGPNAKLSHKKFGIELEDLDKFPMNIIPERDPFPRTDDRSLISADILCRAEPNKADFVCHAIARTSCEIMHICGSGMRPPIKECMDYGYPDPEKVQK